ncbi:MAG: fibronectin type III domain-containing protein, partial [Candidatus Pacebacteria bacterium]|nr:fibronectin type III domain-containing protein [Candidatus Paceibacterota bacterium]
TDTHTYTDTGLGENIIYCYSAWAYDERTDMYSNGFVLACGGIPPSDPSGLSISSTTNSFTLSFTKGSASNTVIRRSINTAPTTIEEGTAVYNSTGSSFTDSDPTLAKNTTYCYSIWSYNPSTAALSTSHISGCGTLSNMASPTNLTFPTVAYNSIILNWTPGTGSTKTYIVRKQGSIPTNKDDGTVVYNDSGNAFIDTGLTTNTQYCYAMYATDETDYSEPITGCRTTLTGTMSMEEITDGNYIVNKFIIGTSTGSLTTTWIPPAGVTEVDLLIVGGGGGGGGLYSSVGGGGGGAGGLIYQKNYSISQSSYGITVGSGGTCQSNGANSSFSDIIAIGGGSGGYHSTNSGWNGGSGGGQRWSASVGKGVSGQGNDGGSCVITSPYGSTGGGGGAGSKGADGTNIKSGDGGSGLSVDITGTPIYYAGGGGGSAYDNSSAGGGGIGGGGSGGKKNSGGKGTDGLGGGGRGGSSSASSGGRGGSGVVIIRYLDPQ